MEHNADGTTSDSKFGKEGHLLTGQLGEDLALGHLQGKGYVLIVRNYRYKHGEIDLVMEKAGVLYFFEVRTRYNGGYGDPEASVSRKKEDLLLKTAEAYQLETGWSGPIQFDVIAILLEGKRLMGLTHFQDAIH